MATEDTVSMVGSVIEHIMELNAATTALVTTTVVLSAVMAMRALIEKKQVM